jgi:DNA polymerase (family X)
LTLSNRDIANTFDAVADMLELKGEIIHRILSYRRAAEAIRNTPRDLNALAAEGELESIPGIGKVLAEKIQEMVDTGKLDFYEKLAAEIPPGVLDILHINGVGPKKALRFWQEKNITSIAELEKAAREGQLRGMSGMGAKTEQKIIEGIESLARQETTRIRIGDALPAAQQILDLLLAVPGAKHGAIAGSIRRGRPTIGDVDILIASDDAAPIMDTFVSMGHVGRVLGHGPTKSSVELLSGLQVDVRVLSEERWGTALAYFTGSQAHNIKIRELALARGLSLNEHAFTPVNGGPEILCSTEDEVYEKIGLQWITPEIRENWGEIEAAQKHTIPAFIRLEDMQADLHMHTTWSDGTLSVRQMADAALQRGRKYIVITDHSRSIGIANGLSIERLMEQHEEVRRVDSEMNGAIRVFHGTEMEINADGTLDFPDDVLAQLDFVIASLHVGLRQPREQVTARILNAINNPHVDLIGHPRGQLIPNREPADLDMDAVFAAAQKSGIALEINANPHRLDLEAQYARRAAELGIPICIDSDAHRENEMDLLNYGILTARRGWVQASSVINTWPLERFLDWVQKRGK